MPRNFLYNFCVVYFPHDVAGSWSGGDDTRRRRIQISYVQQEARVKEIILTEHCCWSCAHGEVWRGNSSWKIQHRFSRALVWVSLWHERSLSRSALHQQFGELQRAAAARENIRTCVFNNVGECEEKMRRNSRAGVGEQQQQRWYRSQNVADKVNKFYVFLSSFSLL